MGKIRQYKLSKIRLSQRRDAADDRLTEKHRKPNNANLTMKTIVATIMRAGPPGHKRSGGSEPFPHNGHTRYLWLLSSMVH